MQRRSFRRTLTACVLSLACVALDAGPLRAQMPDIPNDIRILERHNLASACEIDHSRAIGAAAAVVAQNAGVPTSAGGTDAPAPSPSPSASLSPLPKVPNGPQQFTIPTLAPSGPPTASPLPLPTPTPSSKASPGPVFLQQGSPRPDATIAPKTGKLASPSPTPSPTPSAAGPTPIPTLRPGEVSVLSDTFSGSSAEGQPSDWSGNVHVFFSDEIAIADQAHYDGNRTITLTGKPYIINNAGDSILHGDIISVDTKTKVATLQNGRGETTEGVEVGKLHFAADKLTSSQAGRAHGDRANISTCENPHAGYHITGKTVDVMPGDKMVIRKALLFLGGVAVLFVPIIIIPLKTREQGPGNQKFFPDVGYNQFQGYYVKTNLGFGKDQYYYGYYKVDYFTKLGLGLGYNGNLNRRDGRRQDTITFYEAKQSQGSPAAYQLQVTDTENFSSKLRGSFNYSYNGVYGPNISLPPSYNLTGSVNHTGTHANQSYQFSRSGTGTQQNSLNVGFTDQHIFSPTFTQGLTLGYSKNTNTIPTTFENSSLHINTLTHVSTRSVDFDLTVDKTDSTVPSGIQKEPELVIRPHPLLPRFKVPFTTQFTYGLYSEAQSNLTTTRGEATLNAGPVLLKLFKTSDFSAGFTVRQDAYGTGDLKAAITQNASLTTPIGHHIINAITYNENNTSGPTNQPFQTLDILGGGSKSAQEVLRIFNGDVYNLTLSTGTSFMRQAQPVSYQLSLRPSMRSYLTLSGSYNPGPGNGFFQTNVQAITPFGRDTQVQLLALVDWKNKGRIGQKVIYLSHVFGQCYDVHVLYNQSLKTVNVSVDLLAFPSRAVTFGLTKGGPIIPQSFNF